MDVILIGQ